MAWLSKSQKNRFDPQTISVWRIAHRPSAFGTGRIWANIIGLRCYGYRCDITGDGQPEVIVVESQKSKGARLAIYSTTAQPKRIAATPYIGSANRWLAPIGFADFNNDGDVDIAYVDRPHLAKILRVWTYKNAKLTETANIDGLSNHRIGDNFISGGVRTCAGTPEIITADGGWKRIISTRFENGALTKTDIGPYRNKSSFKRALTC